MRLTRTLAIILLVILLFWLLAQTALASAQTPATPTVTLTRAFYTPTPLPAIIATANAAQQRANDAQASLQQAAQLEARAAEIRRNAEVQSDAASQAWSDARAASAAQNAAAVGEAIGRGEANTSQLQASVNGMASIVTTLTARTEEQAGTIISLTNELQQARAERKTVVDAYVALEENSKKQQADGQTTSALNYIVEGFIFVVVAVLLVAVIWRVISNRRDRVMAVNPDKLSDSEQAINGEFKKMDDDQSADVEEGTLGQ